MKVGEEWKGERKIDMKRNYQKVHKKNKSLRRRKKWLTIKKTLKANLQFKISSIQKVQDTNIKEEN